jgi:hypothetical protein
MTDFSRKAVRLFFFTALLLPSSSQSQEAPPECTPGINYAYVKAGDVLQEDGNYSVRLSIDGKPYGTYPFTVKDHSLQLQGRQRREDTDPLEYLPDYVSGGRYRSWWISKEK